MCFYLTNFSIGITEHSFLETSLILVSEKDPCEGGDWKGRQLEPVQDKLLATVFKEQNFYPCNYRGSRLLTTLLMYTILHVTAFVTDHVSFPS